MTGGFSTFPSGAFDSGCYDHPHYLFDRRNFAFDLYDLADYIDRRLERLMKPLKKVHFPVHELSMMMTIALRFIPTLIEETDKIMNAQKARGADLESGGIMQRAKALVPILIPLFVSAFRRADELALAMECRCIGGMWGAPA